MKLDNGMNIEMVEALLELVPVVEHKNEHYYGVLEADGDNGFEWIFYVWDQAIKEWCKLDDVPDEVMSQFDPY